MDFGWNEEQRLWRDAVRNYAQKEIAPRSREIDTKERIPGEIIQGMADLGLWAPVCSERYGGAEMDWTLATVAAEELGKADISLAVPVTYLVEAAWAMVLEKYGDQELKEELLPKVTTGEQVLGIAITESGGGSDILQTCQTKAVQEESTGDWILNGEKIYISLVRESLDQGGVHMLLARTNFDPGAGHKAFTFFALPIKDMPGISPTYFDNMGRKGISTGGFAMENVRLPDAYRVGQVDRGFYHAMEGFSAARILIGATCIGAAEAVLELGIEHVKERQAFGRALASFEGIQFPLANYYAELEGTRLQIYKAAWMLDQMYTHGTTNHKEIALAASLAKLRAPILGFQIMNEVADWFGAMAYTKECPVEMGIRAIRSYSIGAEGGMNILRIIIARELLGAEFLPYRQ
jgi:acyl-CoA dehydrogenase